MSIFFENEVNFNSKELALDEADKSFQSRFMTNAGKKKSREYSEIAYETREALEHLARIILSNYSLT